MSPRSAGQLDGDGALGGRHRGVRVGVDALQLHQPGAEHREHHRDHHEPERGAAAAASRAGCRAERAAPGRRSRDRTTHRAGLGSAVAVVAVLLVLCLGSVVPDAGAVPCLLPVARAGVRGESRGRPTVTTCGAGSSTAGFGGARGSSRSGVVAGGRGGRAEDLAVREPEERRGWPGRPCPSAGPGRRPAAGRGARRAPSAGSARRAARVVACCSSAVAAKDACCIEVLNSSSPTRRRAARGHQGHERQRAVPASGAGGTTVSRARCERRAGEAGDAAGSAGAADPAGPDLEGGLLMLHATPGSGKGESFDGAQPDRGGARVVRRSRRRRPSRRRG